jgi:hypothetical protein
MEDTLRRTRVLKAGMISFGRAAISCAVRNRTKSGAMLDVASPLGIPNEFTLVRLTMFTTNAGSSGSRKGLLGVRFERSDGGTETPTKAGVA